MKDPDFISGGSYELDFVSKIKSQGTSKALKHVPKLIELLDHENLKVRYDAALILHRISEDHFGFFQNTAISYEIDKGENLRKKIKYILKELRTKESPVLTFDDVGGLENLKETIRENIIYPFLNPTLASEFGIKGGGGALFYGPPGCGKTYIVKAAIGETALPFVNVKISDVVSKYYGETEKNVAKVFDEARKRAPSILFIDEIDALGGRRDASNRRSEKMEVNQLLSEMDGLVDSNENVLVIGATNAPWNLDPALRRPGRFSYLLYVPAPDFNSRKEIFRIHLSDIPNVGDVALEKLAELTKGYSASDIAGICNDAKIIPWKHALKTGRKRNLKMSDFIYVIKKRPSSLDPWYRMAKFQIEKSGEKDLFRNLYEDSIRYFSIKH